MKKDNSNEFTQLTIDNLTQTTVFEMVEEVEEEEPYFCRNLCETRNMLNCCTCNKFFKFSNMGGEL